MSFRPSKIAAATSYEVNIWNIRPNPTYATSAIVDLAPVPVPTTYKAGGKWNSLEIEARGSLMTVKLNGVVTATGRDSKFLSGPISLQYGFGVNGAMGGPIKWRKVIIRPL